MSENLSSGKKTLLMLAVVFVLPFTLAAILHFLDVRPGGKSYGELITPPVALTIPTLQDAQGEAFAAENWQKKWNIVTIVRDVCDEACQTRTHLLGNVRLSLAKDSKRVQHMMLILKEINAEVLVDLQQKNPELIILTGNEAAPFADTLEQSSKSQSIYLVDPLGNLMMQYPQNLDPKGLRSDLVRLLKSSWAG